MRTIILLTIFLMLAPAGCHRSSEIPVADESPIIVQPVVEPEPPMPTLTPCQYVSQEAYAVGGDYYGPIVRTAPNLHPTKSAYNVLIRVRAIWIATRQPYAGGDAIIAEIKPGQCGETFVDCPRWNGTGTSSVVRWTIWVESCVD